MDLKRMTKAFLKLRDARTALKRTFEDEDRKLKQLQERIETEMLRHLNETNVNSVATEVGTFFRQMKVTPRGDDWDALFAWVKEHDAFEIFEKRIKTSFIKEHMEAHDGGLPPGVSVLREYEVSVRRASH